MLLESVEYRKKLFKRKDKIRGLECGLNIVYGLLSYIFNTFDKKDKISFITKMSVICIVQKRKQKCKCNGLLHHNNADV